MKKLFPVLIALLVLSCASDPDRQYTYTTSDATIAEARQRFRQSDYNYLSLLLVDRAGKVVEVRKLASKLDSPRMDLKVKKAMYQVQFTRAAPDDTGPYREFVFPFRVGRDGDGDPTDQVRRAHEPNDFIRPDQW